MRSLLSENEYNLIEQFVVLEYTKQVLERDLDKIPKAGFKFSGPYEQLIVSAIHKLSNEMRTVRVNIKEIGLKFNEKGVNNINAIEFEWFRGGYQGETAIRALVLKELVQVKISELLSIKR